MSETDLPILPVVVTRVTEAAADPECGATDLAHIIQQDPVLSARVLQAVNTSFYSPRCQVTSVQRAVSFMGINAVRNLVLCMVVRQLYPPRTDIDLEIFWEWSLRRAAASNALARQMDLPPDECFTLGLCQDLGLLVACQQHPGLAQEYAAVLQQSADERLALERTVGVAHAETGYALFRSWNFPESMALAIRFHHDLDSTPEVARSRARLAHVAETIADLLGVADKATAMERFRAEMDQIGVPVEDLTSLVDQVGEMVHATAEMLQFKVGQQPRYEELAAKASQSLMALTLNAQQMYDHLQQSLQEQQRMAEQLRDLNRQLEQQATTDGLTHLPNRRAFDEALVRELARAQRQTHPLSLLLLDVDHFKKFNDTHGHQAGDLVLQEVGRCLQDQVRTADFPARYGGEEFVVVLPFTPADRALIAAERVRAAIEHLAIDWNSQRLRVTVSLGCAELGPHAPDGPALIKQADDALYRAKEQGRNRVVLAE